MKYGTLAKLGRKETWVLPRYEQYLRRDHDRVAEAAALKYILTKNSARVREGTWSASSAGKCLRSQQFVYHGVEQGDTGDHARNIFANGEYVHLRYQVAGLVGEFFSDVEIPVRIDGYNVVGTVDAITTDKELVEIKSCNSNTFRKVSTYREPIYEHKCQATAYMQATGLRTTRFVYENKDNNKPLEIVYKYDEEFVARNYRSWSYLNELEEQERLVEPQKDCVKQQGSTWSYCPFRRICLDQTYAGIAKP